MKSTRNSFLVAIIFFCICQNAICNPLGTTQPYILKPVPATVSGAEPITFGEFYYIVLNSIFEEQIYEHKNDFDKYSQLPEHHWFTKTLDFRLRNFYSCAVCLDVKNLNRSFVRYEMTMEISRILFDMAKGQAFSYPQTQAVFDDIDQNHWAFEEANHFSWVWSTFGKSFNGNSKVTIDDSVAVTNSIIKYLATNYPSIFALAPDRSFEPETHCPENMLRITANKNSFCIDEYEFPNVSGVIPSSGMTGRAAALVCAMEGKRLCTASEWQTACRGPENEDYIYGNHYLGGFCNDFLMSRGEGEVKASGEIVGCVNGYGLYDMSGNLAEWTAPEPQPDGTTIQRVRGGSFSQDQDETALSCSGATVPGADNRGDNSYQERKTLGTRCCTD